MQVLAKTYASHAVHIQPVGYLNGKCRCAVVDCGAGACNPRCLMLALVVNAQVATATRLMCSCSFVTMRAERVCDICIMDMRMRK